MTRPGMPASAIRPLTGGMSPSYAGNVGSPSPQPQSTGNVGQMRRPSGSGVASPATSDRPITPRTPGPGPLTPGSAGRVTPGRMTPGTPGHPNPSPSPDPMSQQQQQPPHGYNPQQQMQMQHQQRMMGPQQGGPPGVGGGGNPNHPGVPGPPQELHGWGNNIFGLKGGAIGPVIGRPGYGRVLGGWGYFVGLKGGSPIVTSGVSGATSSSSSAMVTVASGNSTLSTCSATSISSANGGPNIVAQVKKLSIVNKKFCSS